MLIDVCVLKAVGVVGVRCRMRRQATLLPVHANATQAATPLQRERGGWRERERQRERERESARARERASETLPY